MSKTYAGSSSAGKTTSAAAAAAAAAKNQGLSRSARAGLQFPVGRIHRFLKEHCHAGGRVGATAAVYSAAILEYLTAEVLELAGSESETHYAKTSPTRYPRLGDEELDQLIKATIAGGGVIPHIHKSLIGGKDKEEGEGDEGTDQADTEGGGTEGDNTQ